MTPEMIGRVRQAFDAAQRILLTTHQSPDGDGLGSQVALAAFLRSAGKEVVILNPDPVPDRYRASHHFHHQRQQATPLHVE